MGVSDTLLKTELIQGSQAFTKSKVNYFYSDAEGDLEAGSPTFQWYRYTTENGNYEAIVGETEDNYTPASPVDTGKLLKVKITPSASTGITAGTAVMSSATIQITSPS
jgi:hypothetical protein